MSELRQQSTLIRLRQGSGSGLHSGIRSPSVAGSQAFAKAVQQQQEVQRQQSFSHSQQQPAADLGQLPSLDHANRGPNAAEAAHSRGVCDMYV